MVCFHPRHQLTCHTTSLTRFNVCCIAPSIKKGKTNLCTYRHILHTSYSHVPHNTGDCPCIHSTTAAQCAGLPGGRCRQPGPLLPERASKSIHTLGFAQRAFLITGQVERRRHWFGPMTVVSTPFAGWLGGRVRLARAPQLAPMTVRAEFGHGAKTSPRPEAGGTDRASRPPAARPARHQRGRQAAVTGGLHNSLRLGHSGCWFSSATHRIPEKLGLAGTLALPNRPC